MNQCIRTIPYGKNDDIPLCATVECGCVILPGETACACCHATPNTFIEKTLKSFDELFTKDCWDPNPQIPCRHWSQEDNVGGVRQFLTRALTEAYEQGKIDGKQEINDAHDPQEI